MFCGLPWTLSYIAQGFPRSGQAGWPDELLIGTKPFDCSMIGGPEEWHRSCFSSGEIIWISNDRVSHARSSSGELYT